MLGYVTKKKKEEREHEKDILLLFALYIEYTLDPFGVMMVRATFFLFTHVLLNLLYLCTKFVVNFIMCTKSEKMRKN